MNPPSASVITNVGGYQFGSIDVNFSSSGTTTLENLTLTYPTKRVEHTDANGNVNGFVLQTGLPTGSATAQFPLGSGSTPTRPVIGEHFDYTFTGTNGNETWMTESVGQAYESNGYMKFNIGLVKKVA